MPTNKPVDHRSTRQSPRATGAEIECCGETLRLLPEHGVFLPEHAALLVADTHFGKDASFRKGGLAVPRGSSEATLECIEKMIVDNAAHKLVFLGDLFHARCSLSEAFSTRLEEFFLTHTNVEVYLTLGNHDVAVGRLPTHWNLQVSQSLKLGKFTLEHFPREADADEVLCCGHLHPAVHIQEVGKLPCFWLSEQRLMLPAIGKFTGTAKVIPRGDDMVWVTDGESLHRL